MDHLAAREAELLRRNAALEVRAGEVMHNADLAVAKQQQQLERFDCDGAETGGGGAAKASYTCGMCKTNSHNIKKCPLLVVEESGGAGGGGYQITEDEDTHTFIITDDWSVGEMKFIQFSTGQKIYWTRPPGIKNGREIRDKLIID